MPEIVIIVLPLQKNLMWNTVTVQYNPLIEEEWDEHFKVTCEYGYDFWKTVTFPFLDVEWVVGIHHKGHNRLAEQCWFKTNVLMLKFTTKEWKTIYWNLKFRIWGSLRNMCTHVLQVNSSGSNYDKQRAQTIATLFVTLLHGSDVAYCKSLSFQCLRVK